MRTCVFLLTLAAAGTAAAAPDDDKHSKSPGLTEREKAIHVLSRLSFGPRPGDVDRVTKAGWKAWVDRQLQPKKIDDSALERRLKTFESLRLTCRELMEEYRVQVDPRAGPDERRRQRRLRKLPARELCSAVLLSAVLSERQLQEVMVDFWRNHFNVSLDKGLVQWVATDWDRTVLREHVFGRFEDLLLASAKHPAMLFYLDNAVSQKPLTKTEEKYLSPNRQLSDRQKKLLRQRGLNENYARELLELHTLGVDNVYKQHDVRELARVLTGWTFSRGPKADFTFVFRKDVHDVGPKRVLKTRLPGKGGLEEGEAVIRGLARHKGTARFIAFKLCRYLVSDVPDEQLVADVAAVFHSTKGDLREVTRAVIMHEQFFARKNFRCKFKTPFELVASALRAVDAQPQRVEPLLKWLTSLSQPIYRCEDPTGYYDVAESWRDPGVMSERWRFGVDLGAGRIKGLGLLGGDLVRALRRTDSDRWADTVIAQLLPQGAGERTEAILRATAARSEERAGKTLRRLVGLTLGSPEFQLQ